MAWSDDWYHDKKDYNTKCYWKLYWFTYYFTAICQNTLTMHVHLGSFMKLTGIQNFLLLLSVGGKCRIWVRSHGSNWYSENNKICKWVCSHYYYEAFQLWRTEAPSWSIVSLAGTLITAVSVNISYMQHCSLIEIFCYASYGKIFKLKKL